MWFFLYSFMQNKIWQFLRPDLIRDPPKNQWKLLKLLYKVGENLKKLIKTLSRDPVIGFQWTFFCFVALDALYKIKKDNRNWTGRSRDNRKIRFYPCHTRFRIGNLVWHGLNRILRLSRDLPVRFRLSFFYFVESVEGYKTKKSSLKSNHWISR